jgi:uncharacterized membrane protein
VNKLFWKHCQSNFWAGFAIVLPAVISIALLIWLFDSVANITDTLLVFMPRRITHTAGGAGKMYWYWSLVAFMLALVLIAVVGQLARHYFGRKAIEWVDSGLLSIPLLNKIYSATKQVNDAFSTTNKTAFRTAVIIEFPSPGRYAIGFITSEIGPDDQNVCEGRLLTVFVPTTPNPTSGFLILSPEENVKRLQIPVAEAIKFIISLGSISPNLKVTNLDARQLEDILQVNSRDG